MPPARSFEAKDAPRGSTAKLVVTPDVRRSLLELVQLALAVATGGAEVSALDRALDRMRSGDGPGVVFVTLTENGALRGCMGNLEPTRRLGEAVAMSAISAALDDPRFLPVTGVELPAIHVEISVLGPPTPIVDPNSFQPGVDGVLVERNGRRGLLLPEVATEFSWGAIEMFDAVCRKAGLARGAWCDPTTRLSTFRTVRFGGPAIGAG
ncbi:MAG: AmmeMemoRadiSam system protein A [Candidatus Limnocylindrales bacterium]